MTICGEDSAASREYVYKLKKEYRDKQHNVLSVKVKELTELLKSEAHASSLFKLSTTYFTEQLSSYLAKNKTKEAQQPFEEGLTNESVIIINWEADKPARDLRSRLLGTIKEFKPASSVFTLLDACYPGNLHTFVKTLQSVVTHQDELFVFTMLSRHIRLLIRAGARTLPNDTPSWQKSKLISQASKWEPNKLISFYEGLMRIDRSLKTSTNTHGITKSVQLLSCYFL